MARKRSLTADQVKVARVLRRKGVPVARIARRFRVTGMTVYRWTWPERVRRAEATRRATLAKKRYAAAKRKRAGRRSRRRS